MLHDDAMDTEWSTTGMVTTDDDDDEEEVEEEVWPRTVGGIMEDDEATWESIELEAVLTE